MSWRRPCDSERGRCCGRPSAQRVSAGRLPVSGSFPSKRPIPAWASRLRRGVDAVNLVDESAGTASTNCRTVAQVACPPLAGVATRNRVAGGGFRQGRSPFRENPTCRSRHKTRTRESGALAGHPNWDTLLRRGRRLEQVPVLVRFETTGLPRGDGSATMTDRTHALGVPGAGVTTLYASDGRCLARLCFSGLTGERSRCAPRAGALAR